MVCLLKVCRELWSNVCSTQHTVETIKTHQHILICLSISENNLIFCLTQLAGCNYFPIKDNDVGPSAAINTTQINSQTNFHPTEVFRK